MDTKKEVYLYEKLGNRSVCCNNCAHYCHITSGNRGICGVRQNIEGQLYALNYGKVTSLQVDPIEKKPLFHFLPGTKTLSLATVGCNFRCANCQNWEISQYPKSHPDIPGETFMPSDLVNFALEQNLPSISYTYVEPTIFSEYAIDIMKLARENNLRNVWVSNGFMSKECIKMITPYLDADNIDIKSFSDSFYRTNCGARLQPVLDTAKEIKEAGIWLEVTTLIIPTLNDSDNNLTKIAEFIAKELGAETPWHVTQFSGAISWKLNHISDTSSNTLCNAYDIGKKAGLRYVYSGNILGMNKENTYCPNCNTLCIRRLGYSTERFDEIGKCPNCGQDLNIIQQ